MIVTLTGTHERPMNLFIFVFIEITPIQIVESKSRSMDTYNQRAQQLGQLECGSMRRQRQKVGMITRVEMH